MKNLVEKRGKLLFTVDSALLRELGERLVGKAHIALAELVKNSFDADATKCTITFRANEIEIVDDGHGMTLQEFERFWMRVGTTHKAGEVYSRTLRRPLTGSKGVGRLAVQFLANKVEIQSTAAGGNLSLNVKVDWNDAVHHEFITEASADFELTSSLSSYANDSPHGFRVILSGLRQDWDNQSLKGLAQEVWTLKAPFDGFAGKGNLDQSHNFNIEIESSEDTDLELSLFSQQASAAIEQWIAKIEGVIERGRKNNKQRVKITFQDGKVFEESFYVSENENCQIDSATWEIRIFNLSGHYGSKIKVGDARKYFSEFGGVHVYDGPFRLPYYGIEQDWLGIELDHSHRKVRSALLPSHFHVERALNDLPTQGRILGVVRINTGSEHQHASPRAIKSGDYLKIQVTRDRLQINKAYDQLKNAVRRSVDLYAVFSMRQRHENARRERPELSPVSQAVGLQGLLSEYKNEIPKRVYNEVSAAIETFTSSVEKEQVYSDSITSLLGPLATAGMSALALEHETSRQLSILERIAKNLSGSGIRAEESAKEIRKWILDFKSMRRVFEPLANQEDRETIKPLRAARVIDIVIDSLQHFMNSTTVTQDIPTNILLPAATFVEWQGIFQNVFTNALNAMLAVKQVRKIHVDAGYRGKNRAWVHISDSGSGVDLSDTETLFEPFRRKGDIPEQRRAMGLGGHGLGLTIVQMIAESRGCSVRFVEPAQGFNTTFEIEWRI
ncbi:ATP-binding protein [Pseudomonas sp. lyk4-TYG-107]|uniref:ATP-binding protein n=1 Tax=Pseudomonas sp. lyk4-TYG-107 TaxID=3040317 RepID=UPI00255548C1|nr:ATP-binding protein [Pseudomonas sp. lyk4-TYG-107]